MPYSFEEINELSKSGNIKPISERKSDDVGFFESALAGVATGALNIPKGFISLGAQVYDLIGDTNTSKEVEDWFEKINPFDDAAEAQTIGKLTKLVTEFIPVGYAAKIGKGILGSEQLIANIAKNAVEAKQAGKYLSLSRIGQTIVGPKTGAILGAGIGGAIISDDEMGTLGDMLKGTSLEPYWITVTDQETKEGRQEAARKLLNRIKFGAEIGLLDLGLTGIGAGIGKLRAPAENVPITKLSENPLVNVFQRAFYGLKPSGFGTAQTFEAKQGMFGNIAEANLNSVMAAQKVQSAMDEIWVPLKDTYLNTKTGKLTEGQAKNLFLRDIYEVLSPTEKSASSLLKQEAKDKISLLELEPIKKIKQKYLYRGQEISEEVFAQLPKAERDVATTIAQEKRLKFEYSPVRGEKKTSLFSVDDYAVNDKLKQIANKIEDAGGDAQPLIDSLINFRSTIDNISVDLLRKGMPANVANGIKNQLGKYLTSSYKSFSELPAAERLTVMREQREPAIKAYFNQKIKEILKKDPNAIITEETKTKILNDANKTVNGYIRSGEKGEDVLQAALKTTESKDLESIKINTSILRKKELQEFEEELFGLKRNPVGAYLSTIDKQSTLNHTLGYMETINSIGSKQGVNKFVFKPSQLTESQRNNPKEFTLVKSTGIDGLNALDGKYVQSPIYESLFDVKSNWLETGTLGPLYKYAILVPKAATQSLKTVYSVLTQVRNAIQGLSFVSANGIPYGELGAIEGKNLFSLSKDISFGKIKNTYGDVVSSNLASRITRSVGLDTSVVLKENQKLVEDVLNGKISESEIFKKATNLMGKKVSKVSNFANNLYAAVDNYPKVINWGIERNRYEKVFNNMGINKDNYFKLLQEESEIGKYLRKMAPRAEAASESYQSFLDEVAGNLTRNNIPNYAYVGRTGQALRQSPFGNFIAYPLEIMRSGSNIYQSAIDEISFGKRLIKLAEESGTGSSVSKILNKQDLIKAGKLLQGVGNRRLLGFGITTTGLPVTLVAGFQAINDVSNDELNSLRRFVPEWAKNSTLIPVGRNEKGYLKYIDFGYANAYDPLIRPFGAIMTELAQGSATKESLMASLGKGLMQGTSELLKPFASESIYTEALIDSVLRNGVDKEGKRVWSQEDDPFVKVLKSVNHIAKTFTPGSYSQLKRISEAAVGKSDQYGRKYELKDELNSLYGFRVVQTDPESDLTYKVTKFGSRLDKDRNLFSTPLLKGGRVKPEDIVDSYAYSEARRFQTMKEMYLDIDAARKMGVSNRAIKEKLKARKGLDKDDIESVMRGKYLPGEPNKFFIEKMQEINRNLNRKENVFLPNPYSLAKPTINSIASKNKGLNLKTDSMKVPFAPMQTGVLEPESTLPIGVNTTTTPVSTPIPIINDQTSSLPNQQVDRQQRYASLFPGDVLGEEIAANQQTKPITLVG
jgi:hypothetical protein